MPLASEIFMSGRVTPRIKLSIYVFYIAVSTAEIMMWGRMRKE
jgi:hypothetical protein